MVIDTSLMRSFSDHKITVTRDVYIARVTRTLQSILPLIHYYLNTCFQKLEFQSSDSRQVTISLHGRYSCTKLKIGRLQSAQASAFNLQANIWPLSSKLWQKTRFQHLVYYIISCCRVFMALRQTSKSISKARSYDNPTLKVKHTRNFQGQQNSSNIVEPQTTYNNGK